MRRLAPLMLALIGLTLTASALWLRLELTQVDGGGAARLRRVVAAWTGRTADIRRWHDRAVACAIVGPALTVVAYAWWRLAAGRAGGPAKPAKGVKPAKAARGQRGRRG